MVYPARPPSAAKRPHRLLLAGFLLALAVMAAYANSLAGPFFYDDGPAIVENRTLRGSLWDALHPPSGTTVSGRPLLNLSFALNYRFGGLEVRGYHVVNLAIHIAATLVLLGLVRRTLELPSIAPKLRERAGTVAWLAAAWWGLQPVQTEAVTFVVQRAESLLGLCFLLTFYGFVRGAAPGGGTRWWVLSVAACWCGMAVKEVMVTAPVLLALYDRLLVSGSWRTAWTAHRRYYGVIVASWLVLGALVVTEGGNRGGSMGAGSGIDVTTFWLTQVPAISRYLGLSVWPAGLVFDYGYGQVAVGAVAPWVARALVVLVAIGAWILAMRRFPRVGFLGTWFFLILAPTSVIPGGQTIAEHRLYLSLAAVTVGGAMLLVTLAPRAALSAGAGLAVILGGLTAQRNHVYRSEIAVWSDSLAKFPTSAQAHNNLGAALAAGGEVTGAVAEFRAALGLVPGFVEAHYNLGRGLAALGQNDEAIAHYEEAICRRPQFGAAHGNLGTALFAKGQPAAAREHFREAVRWQPGSVEALANLGNAELAGGEAAVALKTFERALALDAGSVGAHYGAGNTLWTLGRREEAIAHFKRALELRPDFGPARDALVQAGAGR